MSDNLALKEYADHLPIGDHKKACPLCSHTRKKNKNDLCLSLKVMPDRMVFNCFHCQESGVIQFRGREKVQVHQIDQHRTQKLNIQPLSEEAFKWLESRGISKQVAKDANLFSSDHWINSENSRTPCIGFPYERGSITAGAKMRSLGSKGFSCTSALQWFFNINSIGDGDYFVICEGEIDALSFVQAGIKSAVSVPNGAVGKVKTGAINPEDDRTFNFLWDAKEKLDNSSKIIIATDGDTAGNAMAEELARRIGRDRCWRIVYPEGYKDANEVLLDCGEECLVDLVESAEPWPIKGIYDASFYSTEVQDIYSNGLGSGLSTGYQNLDDIYTVASGQLTVVTGIPSSGKSEFIDQLMMNQARQFDSKFAVCSFENEPRLHIAKLASKYIRKPFFDGMNDRMTQDELDESQEFVNKHFTFLSHNDGNLVDLDDLLERLKVAVMRFGITGVVIDPYNYIKKDTDRETDWISEMLTKVRMFGQHYDCHIWFVAHPTKMQRENGKTPVPKGYDISGSAAWFAKADCGITVHREFQSPNTEIHVWKCRFAWIGKQGVCDLIYDPVSTCYREHGFADRYISTEKAGPSDFPAPF